MDRSRFNNILYAIQVLANHDLTGQSQEDAMPYLRAINSCVQSLLEVHWSDMGGMTYTSPPTACASETLRHSYETLPTSGRPGSRLNPQQPAPNQEEPHLVEEEDEEASQATQVIHADDNMDMDISDTEEDAEEEEEAEYDADDMEVQHYTIPEDQRWVDRLHPNVSARRPLPLDENPDSLCAAKREVGFRRNAGVSPTEEEMRRSFDDDDYIQATAVVLSDEEMEMRCVQPCIYCEETPNVADVYTTSCGHMLCKECYVHSQPYPFANIPHRCPACQTKSPQLFEYRAQNQI